MTLTKESLVNTLQNHLGLPKTRARELLESIIEIMKRALESGEDVLVTGFGKFSVRDKGERMGRNPRTGEDVPIEARRGQRKRPRPMRGGV